MKLDLHIHSCLSPCGDEDMTPNNIVNMALLCGLEAIALSDHNTCRQCPPVMKAAASAGLLVIPAMELTSAEDIHVLCLLPELKAALEFSDYVYSRIPAIANKPDIFGPQLFMDENDVVTGMEERLLITATSISIDETPALLRSYGGIALPAHIDRPSYSLLANLGVYDKSMGFTAYELSAAADAGAILERNPDLRGLLQIRSSDSHRLEQMTGEPDDLDIGSTSAAAVIEYLRKR